MKKVFLLVLLLSYICYGQGIDYKKKGYIPKDSKLGRLQGMWETEESEGYFISIVKGYYSFYIGRYSGGIYGGISLEGFQDIVSYPYENDNFNLDSLSYNGKYFTLINLRNIDSLGFVSDLIISNFEINYPDEDFNYYDTGTNLDIRYNKISSFPLKLNLFTREQITDLITISKRDQRNYIKEFLDLDVREITTTKTYIYTAPNLKGKMYLLKGDIVTVLEEEKDFVKFEYETDKSRIITGYLKKEDLE